MALSSQRFLVFIFISFFSFFQLSKAQNTTKYTNLEAQFKSYEILDIDSRALFQTINSSRNGSAVKLKINEKTEWNLILENSNIIDPNYIVTEATENGLVRKSGTRALPMQGYVAGQPNSRVSLTFNQDFIYGFISLGATTYFVEPLYHFEEVNVKDQFVIYSINDIIPGESKECGYDQYLKEKDKNRKRVKANDGNRMPGQCLRVEIALAADFLMHQAYGNSTGVQNHNIGVLNNVQTNYDDEFADELQFALMEQWVSTCATCDPWTSSTDSGDLLDDFTGWGVSGFSVSHDVASLWSNRNFDGGTIGLAWVGAVCTSVRYNVLEDFSSNAQLKRVLQAHEIGHNFDASHNSGIMAPSVSSATNWTNTSISEIENYYMGAWCLSPCPNSNAPSANFTYQLNSSCSPAEVEFTNLSSNSTSWLWTFDGGIPATSTDQHPIVSFVDGGTHNVTLQAFSGSASNTITIPIFVNVTNIPVSDFVYNINGLVASFISTGAGGTSYAWDFGDGGVSNSQNPTHTYASNGIYDVTLLVTNACGEHEETYPVEISALPFVNFSASVTTGCQPQNITFTNLSSNTTSFLWTFQGGTPSTSTEANPVVLFANPGTFDITLVATNSAGNSTAFKGSYINISPNPIAGFTFTVNGTQATFVNTAQFGSDVSWSFGDGNTSTQTNPTNNYQNNGIYPVTQTITNACGTSISTQAVTIAVAPVPSFVMSSQGPICANETINYTSTSTYNPTSILWTFEGGNPASSTDPNPIVTYNNAGTFDVTLVVTNANGTAQSFQQDLVFVNAKPSVSFTHLADGLEIDFTQNISNGTGHIWNFGNGQTSTDMNPTHIYGAEGTFIVTLSDVNNCGTTVFSQSIVAQLLPTAGFSATNNTICSNELVQFTNQSSPSVTSWLWTFEGGNPATSTLPNPIVQYSQSGDFNVSLTVTNATGQNTSTQTNFIVVLTEPTVSFDGNVSGNIISLSNTGSGSNASTWSIFNDNVNTQLSGNQINYPAPANGVYNVLLTNSNQCGLVQSDTVQYNINAYPVANLSANNGGTLCTNVFTNYTFSGQNGDSFLWKFEGAVPESSIEQNPNVTYQSIGTFNVQLIVTNALGTDTVNSSVTIGALPISDFSSVNNDNQVNFTYNGIGQNTQFWDFGDGFGTSDLNPMHTYTNPGTYTVTLISQNGCGNDTIVKSIAVVFSSINDVENNILLSVHPNPSNGLFSLLISGDLTGQFEINVSDITGKSLMNKQINISSKYEDVLDLQHVENGVYLLQLKGKNIVKTMRLVVSK